MKLTTRIAIRHLRSRHSFGFISFSTILSVIGLTIGIASLIIISCISRGFSDIVNFKLSGIDGHMRLRSYLSDSISINNITNLESKIVQISDDINSTSPYIEKHALARNGALAEGIILYGVAESSLEKIFKLNQFTSGPCNFPSKESIIIGKKLAKDYPLNFGLQEAIVDWYKDCNETSLY